MSYFDLLSALPADPLLGLMAAARADQRDHTLDVSVGMYRDEHGATPVMAAVRAAGEHLIATQTTKAYEGQRGNEAFCESIETLCLGAELRARCGGRLISLATPGGTGAVWAALTAVRRANADAAVWISHPSWANHRHIAGSVGLRVRNYRYFDAAGTQSVDAEAALSDLAQAADGDAVLIQGPCHNPTGADPSAEQWGEFGRALASRAILPVVDIAYHGLSAPLADDLEGVRSLVGTVPESILCYSCSKNFGLYRERVGAVLAIAASPARRDALASHLASMTRAVYSMPPGHGAALADVVLRTPDLRRKWTDELTHMRIRLAAIRVGLREAFAAEGRDAEFLTGQKGMFSILPLVDGAPETLRRDHAIYMPASGRINVAALREDSMKQLAAAVAPLMQ